MANNIALQSATLLVTAHQSVTLLPRILQILSRRGFILMNLHTQTETGEDTNTITIEMSISGNPQGLRALPLLIHRLVDVLTVESGDIIND